MKIKRYNSGGIGCLGVIGVIFLVLKLIGVQPVANWSWIWVLAPFWIPFALGVCIFVVVMLLMIFANRK